jgi:hypothetical protein
MDTNEVFSESLDFNSIKRRAVAARSYRVKLPPSNSTTFSPEQTINFDLPSNVAGTYTNMSQCYLKFKVTTGGADCSLDRGGAYSFIKRFQISTAGAQIFDCNNWNVLATALLDSDSTAEYKATTGRIMLGTRGDKLAGEELTNGAVRIFCLPLICNPLSNMTPHRLLPLFGLSPIQIRLTLDSVASSVQSGGAPTLAFSDVELVMYNTELSPSAQARIDEMTGGMYNMLAVSWMNSSASIAAGVTVNTSNLGFSMSSLERVVAVHRPQATVNSQAAFSVGNRSRSNLLEYNYLINNEQYPARPVNANQAEAYAEFLIGDHSLSNFNKGNALMSGFVWSAQDASGSGFIGGNIPETVLSNPYALESPAGTIAGDSSAADAAAGSSNIGTYLTAVELESGISDGKSSQIYSGISTTGSTVQFLGKYNAAVASQIDFYAQYTVLLSLNMRGTGVISVKV